MIYVKDCIKKRCIVEKIDCLISSYYEYKFLELSPEKDLVKVKYLSGHIEWHKISDFENERQFIKSILKAR